jgi:hypothetical protein
MTWPMSASSASFNRNMCLRPTLLTADLYFRSSSRLLRQVAGASGIATHSSSPGPLVSSIFLQVTASQAVCQSWLCRRSWHLAGFQALPQVFMKPNPLISAVRFRSRQVACQPPLHQLACWHAAAAPTLPTLLIPSPSSLGLHSQRSLSQPGGARQSQPRQPAWRAAAPGHCHLIRPQHLLQLDAAAGRRAIREEAAHLGHAQTAPASTPDSCDAGALQPARSHNC